MNNIKDNDKNGDDEPLWLFGYGSLLFKPPLHHLPISQDFKRYDGYVNGYARRFWQSSYDNRGTPHFKGRVVTIVPAAELARRPEFHPSIRRHELRALPAALEQDPAALATHLSLAGALYYIPPEHAAAARRYLDFREKDGYTVEEIAFSVTSSPRDDPLLAAFPRNAAGHPQVPCLVYVGTPTNESFVGPEPLEETAAIIHKAVGPSGTNREYLFLLQEQDPDDTYLQELKSLVLEKDKEIRD